MLSVGIGVGATAAVSHVRYVGVLASANKLRPRILPEPPEQRGAALGDGRQNAMDYSSLTVGGTKV